MTVLYVALGGALGAMLRYAAAQTLAFPLATVAVNGLGSFAMGAAFVLLASKGLDQWQPLLMTGLLGGFTTYATFSLDALKLYQSGQPLVALGYIGGTVAVCLLAVTAGAGLARSIS